jgi:hypothetical protein
MKIFFILIILNFFSLIAFSEEIHVELGLISPPALLKEGDVVEGLLKMWPLENADLNEFKKLEGLSLAGALYVADVESVNPSPNNADVVEAKLVIIVKRSKEASAQALSYKGNIYSILTPSLNLAPSEKETDQYFVLDQGLIHSRKLQIIIGLIFLALIIGLYLKRKSLLAKIRGFKEDPIASKKLKFDGQFTSAQNREDYESIYAHRGEWLSLINVVTTGYLNFFSIMELHQYKKFWNQDELKEVENSFDVIRRSFK